MATTARFKEALLLGLLLASPAPKKTQPLRSCQAVQRRVHDRTLASRALDIKQTDPIWNFGNRRTFVQLPKVNFLTDF
jgi:hypothetical protein